MGLWTPWREPFDPKPAHALNLCDRSAERLFMNRDNADLESHPLDQVVARAIRTGAHGALLMDSHVQVELARGQFQIRRVEPQILRAS
jgi:hypothetical protein